MVAYFKDTPGERKLKQPRGEPVKFKSVPGRIKARFVYNQQTGRCQVFYGFDGAEPTEEMPRSKGGLYFYEPFSESNAAYILLTDCNIDVARFEIKPL